MNSYQKSLLFILLPFAMLSIVACNKNTTQAISQTSESSTTTTQDIPPKNITYSGYRLELVNINLTEEKGNVLRVTGTIINTGRNKVVLPSKHSNELVIKFDQSLQEAGYIELSDAIKKRLLKQKINLEPGQMAYNTSLGVKKIGSNTPSATKEETPIQSEAVANKKEKTPIQKEETTIQTEKIAIQKEETTIQTEKVAIQEEEEFVAKGSNVIDEEGCPDLVIESFSVTKRKKKYAEITYTITNKGTAPAALFGEEKAVEDNIAVRAYASGTAKLSRGDMILGGSFIEKGLKEQKGILNPNESYEGVFRIDIRKKTRHMPYLIMFVDTYQGIWECNEGNNVKNITYR